MEEPTITKSKKDAAGPEFNKDHAHCFFDVPLWFRLFRQIKNETEGATF
jgi:hypothetical protein